MQNLISGVKEAKSLAKSSVKHTHFSVQHFGDKKKKEYPYHTAMGVTSQLHTFEIF